MSVNKEASGRRSVESEIEVRGTQEEVWRAIATGPGVSSWFVPTEIEEREGGKVTCHFGPGMDSVAVTTAWEPPHRFAATSADLGGSAPNLTSEWTVEPRPGGACLVSVINGLTSDRDDWDGMLASVEAGWPGFFRVLALYLAHFPGRVGKSFQAMSTFAGSPEEAWAALLSALGLEGAAAGDSVRAGRGAPPFAGVVEAIGFGQHPHSILLRLAEPVPGVASVAVMAMGGRVMPFFSGYLYGDSEASAAAAVESQEALWRSWMKERFPA